MKKVIFFTLFFAALCMIGCQTNNPPTMLDEESIVDLCYHSMGKSGEQLAKDLIKLGINIEHIDSVEQYLTYSQSTKSYVLVFSTTNDSIKLFRYDTFFTSNYEKGIKKYINRSNQIYNYGWTTWEGGRPNLHKNETNHELFIDSIKALASTYTKHNMTIFELMQKNVGENILDCKSHYWATSKGGMNPITGDAISPVMETTIRWNMTLY